ETASNETAKIAVARIGSIALSPDSTLRLVETEKGKHRVALEQGHLRARIWAPPGYFGVRAGSAEVVDLGCDFDLWKNHDGSGRVFVRSGWVSYRVGVEDILVPEGYALSFAGRTAQTPLRPDAPGAFASAVRELERVAGSGDADGKAVEEAAQRVASAARDRDAFTLLSLLSRQPRLASTALYPRLGAALGVRADDLAHRQAWQTGDHRAINAWWKKIPTQPKRWWANWKDALG
ncbi:MAG: FecR domain-containing protein, partial [Luteimonas sp.]